MNGQIAHNSLGVFMAMASLASFTHKCKAMIISYHDAFAGGHGHFPFLFLTFMRPAPRGQGCISRVLTLT